jgi:DNA-binding PadR family transcriptional regulator
MHEETKTPDRRVIELTPDEREALERAMQWPEDLERFDRIAKPTNLTEIQI